MARLGKSNCLTELKLKHSENISEQFLFNFDKLQKLTMRRCLKCQDLHRNFQIQKLVNLIHFDTDLPLSQLVNLSQIKSLHICHLYGDISEALGRLSRDNEVLEELYIRFDGLSSGASPRLDNLLKLTTLQKLTLKDAYIVNSSFIVECTKVLKKLRALKIVGNDHLTDDNILDIVRNAAHLSELNIDYCSKISRDIVEKFKQVSESLSKEEKLKFEFSKDRLALCRYFLTFLNRNACGLVYIYIEGRYCYMYMN